MAAVNIVGLNREFGDVDVQTIRIAALLGNTTGLADFGNGATTAQTIRAVLPSDQSAIPVTQSGTWTVTVSASGLALDTSVNGLLVPVGSTLASVSTKGGPLVQGSCTTAAPSYTTGDVFPLSLTQIGNLRVDGSTVTQPVSGTVTANAGTNLNTSLLALDTSVNGLLLGQASITSGQTGPMVQGAVTLAAPSYTSTRTSPLSLTMAGNLRVDGSTVTQPVSGTVAATQSGTWTIAALTNSSVVKAQLQDNAGNAIASNNSQVQTRDVINTGGQNRAQSVSTSAAEALGGSTILANRKYICIFPTNGTVYWGYTNAVTTSTGMPIFRNTFFSLSVTDNIHIYLIADVSNSPIDCRISEGS